MCCNVISSCGVGSACMGAMCLWSHNRTELVVWLSWRESLWLLVMCHGSGPRTNKGKGQSLWLNWSAAYQCWAADGWVSRVLVSAHSSSIREVLSVALTQTSLGIWASSLRRFRFTTSNNFYVVVRGSLSQRHGASSGCRWTACRYGG